MKQAQHRRKEGEEQNGKPNGKRLPHWITTLKAKLSQRPELCK
jgi:hypothetical protein